MSDLALLYSLCGHERVDRSFESSLMLGLAELHAIENSKSQTSPRSCAWSCLTSKLSLCYARSLAQIGERSKSSRSRRVRKKRRQPSDLLNKSSEIICSSYTTFPCCTLLTEDHWLYLFSARLCVRLSYVAIRTVLSACRSWHFGQCCAALLLSSLCSEIKSFLGALFSTISLYSKPWLTLFFSQLAFTFAHICVIFSCHTPKPATSR